MQGHRFQQGFDSVQAICTPMQTRRNEVSLTITNIVALNRELAVGALLFEIWSLHARGRDGHTGAAH
jgi:hypothetical protein